MCDRKSSLFVCNVCTSLFRCKHEIHQKERITWTARHEPDSLYGGAFLELTNFLELHTAMVAIEATDWVDSNCMLQTFVLLSPRHPWSHDFQCTWAYKCSVWHTHAGKMSLSCLYKFKQDIRKTVKVTQLHIWFLQNCELLIFWSRSNSMNVWRPCWQRLLLQVWVVCVCVLQQPRYWKPIPARKWL